MKFFVSLLLLISFSISFSQTNDVDNKYLEDQFYLGLYYSTLTSSPENFNQNKFSSTLNFGFIRDLPLNKERNFGVGIGAGLSLSSSSSNLKLNELNNVISGEIVSGEDFTKNKWNTSSIEIPFEIRWRTSTPTNYKFWRVYAGFRLGYTIWSQSSLKTFNETIKIRNITELEKLRMGASLSLGYNKFNLFAYYSINPFFNEDATTNDGQKVNFHGIKLGLIFYVL